MNSINIKTINTEYFNKIYTYIKENKQCMNNAKVNIADTGPQLDYPKNMIETTCSNILENLKSQNVKD